MDSLLVVAAICLVTAAAVSPAQQPAAATSKPPAALPSASSWPRVFDRSGTHVVVYQPQLKAWQKYRMLVADTAISITDQGQPPVLGRHLLA
jgi:hypothetical protein